jgi:two-component system cell cycle response regulator
VGNVTIVTDGLAKKPVTLKRVCPDSESERTRVTRQVEGPGPTRPGSACIVVIYGPDLGKRIELGTAPFQMGRSARNDLFIDQESVSRNHARISFDGRAHWLQDNNSTNGTFLNDDAVKEHVLRDGDQIRIGQTILKYMTGENVELAYHEEIYRLMTVDGLTQIFNRRYFDEALEREFNRSKRYARVLSIIVLDIDHFKRVNDTHGHLAGDSLLRQLAATVKGRLRREDVFARTGGEEFGILLPEIPLDGARVTAEKVRRIVETMQVKFDQTVIPCTVSLGVTATDGTESAGTELYKRGDANLYTAKNSGRNRVVG